MADRPDETVAALLADYAGAWAGLAADGIAAFWAPDRFLLYKAEEVDRLFHDWADALDYWRANEALHDRVALAFDRVTAREVAPGRLLATARMAWHIRFAGTAPAAVAGHAMAAENHVVMILVRAEDGWRFALWSETPDAPVAAIRNLYRHRAGDRPCPPT